MGGSVQNMRFLRSFMVLGAVVVLTLFIYASYNSSRTLELPHIRNIAPPSAALTQNSSNHKSNINDSKNTLNTKSTKTNINAAKHMVFGNNHIVHHDGKSIDSVGHHRQPTIDVDAVVELDAEVDSMLEDHDLTDPQFADSNLTTNISAVPLQQSQLESKSNKIVESDFLIPTSNLQKFIENADKILKNLSAVASIDTKSLDRNLPQSNNENSPDSSKNVQSLIAATPLLPTSNKNIKTVSSNVTTTTAISSVALGTKLVIMDPAQGIPTKQIYESGHRDEELNVAQICPASGKDLKLLILITSAQLHQEARLSIRQTWGHYGTRRDVATLFILGRTTNESINTALAQENFIYGDLIRGNFLDTYNNLTLKTISALEWVDRHCPFAKHILKTDDDMFINVPNLLAFLEIHGKEKRVIYGRLAKKWKPIRNKKSKYYVSPGQFAATIYPAFTTGPAYVMTSDIVHELYERSLQQTYLKLEDVFTTGIVAQQCGIKRVHVNEFLNRRIAFNPCNIRKTISVHMIKANEQFDLWKKLLDQTTKCK